MRAHSTLLSATFWLLMSACRCLAQDDPLDLTLPNGHVVHFESAEQKQRFEAARAARAARLAATPPPAATPTSALAATPAVSVPAPLPGTPPVNASAPAFTGDYYGLPKSGAWVGRKVAYVRQQSEDSATPIKFSAYTFNGRPGAAGEHMRGGKVTIVATESAARKLVVQCGTDFRYTASGMTITMLHGVVQPLEGGKDYGVFVDY